MIESVERARPQSALAGILKYWTPPIGWMALIFFISTDTFSGENTGSLLESIFSYIYDGISEEVFDTIHLLIRKAGHLTGYAVLGLLLFRACRYGDDLRWRWKWAIGSLGVVVFYALSDEFHQTFTRHRVGSIYDCMIDSSGAAIALLALWFFRRK